MNSNFTTFMRLVAFAILVLGCVYFCAKTLDNSYAKQEQYAIEHNCRYDYNGLCYTEQERPWLF